MSFEENSWKFWRTDLKIISTNVEENYRKRIERKLLQILFTIIANFTKKLLQINSKKLLQFKTEIIETNFWKN